MKIIKPHKKKARMVNWEDVERVYKDAEEMFKLMQKKHGRYKTIFALSHAQVEERDPLRFFVINSRIKDSPFSDWEAFVVINPVILRHTRHTVPSREGCASFSDMPMKVVQRWNKCEVRFCTLELDRENKPIMGERKTENFNGFAARLFQHEIDHADGKGIFPII